MKNIKKHSLSIILIIILVSVLTACGSKKGSDDQTKTEDIISEEENAIEEECTNELDYEIIEKKDISTSSAKRFTWKIVVEGAPTTEELENLSKEIIDIAKEEQKFNAIALEYSDYKEYIDSGYTLGSAVYAPGGNWEDAGEVKPGQYESMEITYNLREKDWNKQPTEEEAKIHKSWEDLYYEEETPENLPKEEDINNAIAKEFNKTPEEIEDIIFGFVMWQINDENK